MIARVALLAEFDSPERLLDAAVKLRALGLRDLDAFAPYPVPGLEDVLQLPPSNIARWVFACGLLGATFAYLFQWWMTVVDYPLDVGGRPLHSAPAFVPVTFETTVLFGALSAFVAFLVHARLPRLWDPLDEVRGFERASIDRFFLAIGPGETDLARLSRELPDALRVLDVATERAR